jgi:hypothetical protein
MVDKNLAIAIIDFAFFFLEFTPENLLNEDTSMEAFEQLAARLQKMPVDQQKELCNIFSEEASNYKEKSEFVLNLAGAMGIAME